MQSLNLLRLANFGLALALQLTSIALASSPAYADSGWLISNDFLGDTKDRWRSHAQSHSFTYGQDWNGTYPTRPGKLIELQMGGEIITPSNLENPDPDDRPYGGYLNAGLHTHFEHHKVQYNLGVDVAIIGEQSRVHKIQKAIHSTIGSSKPSSELRFNDDRIIFSVTMEAGRELKLTDGAWLRPYAKVRLGIEDYARAGFDLALFGDRSKQFLVRDSVTGHRYKVSNAGKRPGAVLIIGGDTTRVFDSHLLPEHQDVSFKPSRHRVRIGIAMEPGYSSLFAGVTYLSKEFHGQTESQRVGSFSIALRF